MSRSSDPRRGCPRASLRRFAVALALAALAALSLAGPASAANYKVEVCTANAPEGNGLQFFSLEATGILVNTSCAQKVPGGFSQEKSGKVTGGLLWQVVAPPNTRIRKLELEAFFSHSATASVEWLLFQQGSGTPLIKVWDFGQTLPPGGPNQFAIDTTAIVGELRCPFAAGCPGGDFTATMRELKLELEDSSAPTLAGPTLPGGALRGIVDVGFSAGDVGGGIVSASLIVDGVERALVPFTNGGHCQLPYKYLVPCRLEINSALGLDTRALADGQHDIRVAVTDVAGQRRVSGAVDFSVRNVPANSKRPSVSGTAAVGQQLSADPGTWVGGPVSLAYQWLRCPAALRALGDLNGCAPIAGATGRQYVTTSADAGKRLLVQVTARNATGPATEVSAPTDVIPNPTTSGPRGPKITRVTLSRKRIPAAHGNATPKGTLLSFTSDRAGKLTISIDHLRGKKVGKHVITLAATIKSGRSSVPLSSRIGARVLAPGRYRVTIKIRDRKGNYSLPARVVLSVG